MKKICLLLLVFLLFLASSAFATASWEIINKTVSSEVVYAIDANTLVVGGNTANTLEVWTLGGTNKTVPTISGTAPRRISSISFPTALVGYAVGEDTAGSPALYKTTDGGTTWTNSSAGAGFITRLQKVAFYDADHGYVLDTKDGFDNTRIFYTANGGTNWTSTEFYSLQGFNLLACSSSTAIFLGPGPDGYYGSGISFTQINPALSLTYNGTLRAVAHRDGNVFYAVGNYDTLALSSMIRSINGGVTWEVVIGQTAALRDIKFFDANNGIAVGDSGIILQTTNGGAGWTAPTSPTSSTLLSITGTTSTTAYANRAVDTTSILKYVTLPDVGGTLLTPAFGVQGWAGLVTVEGASFAAGITAAFSGSGITVNSVDFNSASKITLDITIASTATVGKRDLTLTNTDGGATTKSNAFEVLAGSGTDKSQTTALPIPNPVKSGSTVDIQFVNPSTSSLTGNIIIISMDGYIPYKSDSVTVPAASSITHNIDISDLANGVYPVWLIGNDGTKVKTYLAIAR